MAPEPADRQAVRRSDRNCGRGRANDPAKATVADRPTADGEGTKMPRWKRTFTKSILNWQAAGRLPDCVLRYCPVLNLCHIRVMVRDCSLETSGAVNNRCC